MSIRYTVAFAYVLLTGEVVNGGMFCFQTVGNVRILLIGDIFSTESTLGTRKSFANKRLLLLSELHIGNLT